MIEPEATGLLFTPGDSKGLKNQIEKLIRDRVLADSIAQQGYISAKNNFSWETL